MAYLDCSIVVDQGSSFLSTKLFFTADPTVGDLTLAVPINLSGKNARMMVRESQDPASAVLLSLNDTGLGGIVFVTQTFTGGPALASILYVNGYNIVITKAQSLAMTKTQSAYYDLFIDDPSSGLSDLWQQGPFFVNATVTR